MRILLKHPIAMLGLLAIGGCACVGPRSDEGRTLAGKACKDNATEAGDVYVEVVYGAEAMVTKPSAKPNACKVKGGNTTLTWYGPTSQRSPFKLEFGEQSLPGYGPTLTSEWDDVSNRQRVTAKIGGVAAQSTHKYGIRTEWGYEDPVIIIEPN